MKLDDLLPLESFSVAGTDVDVGAYFEVDASVAARSNAIAIENTTDSVVKLAVGAAASEVDIPEYVAPGVAKIINRALLPGQRLSVRAVNANATEGFVVVTYMAAPA